jgi:hypothetical protein
MQKIKNFRPIGVLIFHLIICSAIPTQAISPDGAGALPQVIAQTSNSGSTNNLAVQHIHGRVVISGTVSRSLGQPPRLGAHVDVALRDSQGKTLAILTDKLSFHRHPITGRQRNSRFAVSWPFTQYPTASIAQVRYVAHAHSTCDEQGRGQ